MVTTARGFPRFLPTLTEVVQVPAQPVEPPEDLAAKEAERREAFAQRVRQQLRKSRRRFVDQNRVRGPVRNPRRRQS